jgi:hypothetical protein
MKISFLLSQQPLNQKERRLIALIKDKMELELALRHLNCITLNHILRASNRVIRHFHDKKDDLIFRKHVSVTSPCFQPGDISCIMNAISTPWQLIYDIPSQCSGGDLDGDFTYVLLFYLFLLFLFLFILFIFKNIKLASDPSKEAMLAAR